MIPAETLRRIERLETEQSLSEEDYERLIAERTPETAALLAEKALAVRKRVYGDGVFLRGLIEISSFCRNDCYYCGLRRGNRRCARYRLGPEEILACAAGGYALGFRTFVLQGGEDAAFTDELLVPLVAALKERHPDAAVTLSLGERSRESYARLKEAGADRYLLRHETADPALYAKLHPREMSFEDRMDCLRTLRELGYQVGCGFMVGAPFQTAAHLAKDLKFIEDFRPEMCGIGPFLPHRDTPFGTEPAGSLELTLYLLSILRLMLPALLLPATTALGSIHPEGREKGLLAGANVVMPNLSPPDVRAKYEIYNGKLSSGAEAAEGLRDLAVRFAGVGCRIEAGRGDPRPAKAV